MKQSSQAGFTPFIIALIAALSLGGGVWAYKAHEHKKEIKVQQQHEQEAQVQGQSDGEEKGGESQQSQRNLSDAGVSAPHLREGGKTVSRGGDEDYGENHRDQFGDDGEEDDDDYRGTNSNPTPVVTPPTTGGTTTAKTYTLADIKLHNTRASCWTVVNGSVYDVTAWISQHPGGASAIIGMCGIDGSAAFNGQHGDQARPATELASFKIGVLK